MKTLASLALSLSLGLAPAIVPTIAAAQDGGVPAQQAGPGECHGGHGRGGRGMHGDPAARVEHRVRMMTAILDLDATQQARVREILSRSSTEAQALHAQPRSEEGRAAMQALRQRTEQQIEAVLSPTQRATFQRVRAAREEGMRQHRAAHGGR